MAQRQTIRMKRSDRAFLVGATGSGKTTLAMTLLAQVPYLVVLDPKHQFTFDKDHSCQTRSKKNGGGILVTSSLREAAKHEGPCPIVYRPSMEECKRGCEAFWDWIWKRENTIVFVDEVYAVSPGVNIPYGYGRVIQMGRQKNIGVWSATQRPARIPTNIISEAEHVFAFELRNPNDIKRIAEYTDPVILESRAAGHNFWYYNQRDRNAVLLNKDQITTK